MTLLLALLACGGGPATSDDCIPTTGDNCSCEPQCLTERELRRAQRNGVCDLGCMFDSGSFAPNWTCAVEDGACVVVVEE